MWTLLVLPQQWSAQWLLLHSSTKTVLRGSEGHETDAVYHHVLLPGIFVHAVSDSSVGIATRYGLDGPGIESRLGLRDFPCAFQAGSDGSDACCTVGTLSLTGLNGRSVLLNIYLISVSDLEWVGGLPPPPRSWPVNSSASHLLDDSVFCVFACGWLRSWVRTHSACLSQLCYSKHVITWHNSRPLC